MGGNADWLLTDAQVNVALGAEVRAAREAAGLSRPDLVDQLPFVTTTQSLTNWETGKRAISYAKLVEIGRTLHRSAPDLLRGAVERIESIQSLVVELDLRRLCEDANPRYEVLRTWAENKLSVKQSSGSVVRVHHAVVREWAVLLGVQLPDLVQHLESTAFFAQASRRASSTA